MSGPYDDIINLPHPTSLTHPQMSIQDTICCAVLSSVGLSGSCR